jgi:hypothetical protein
MKTLNDIDEIIEKLGFTGISIELQAESFNLASWDDEDRQYIRHRRATVYGVVDDDETDDPISKVELGYIEGSWFLAASALNDGRDIITLADEMNQELYDVAELVYREEDGDCEISDDDFKSNVLYISNFFLKPEARSSGLARWVLFRFVELHDLANLRAVITFPNASHLIGRGKDEKTDPTDPLCKTDLAEGNVRLELFLERLGFTYIDRGFYGLFSVRGWESRFKRKLKKLPTERVRQSRILEMLHDHDDEQGPITVEVLSERLKVPLATILGDVQALVAKSRLRNSVNGEVVLRGAKTAKERAADVSRMGAMVRATSRSVPKGMEGKGS